jgi:DNA/RNA-binding domain of Phe-tRNA-synthetase-like protein
LNTFSTQEPSISQMSSHNLTIHPRVLRKVPDLFVESITVPDITVTRTPESIIHSKKILLASWKDKSHDYMKSLETFKAYSKIQDQFGAYPDNTLPAVENLFVRGILKGKFPTINSVVDACNLVSVMSQLPLGVFDSDKIAGDIILRLAKKDESFTPIGKTKPTPIPEGVPILEDQEKIISIPGVRDSDATKITKHTRNLILFSWGNKVIPVDSVKTVLNEAAHLIKSS